MPEVLVRCQDDVSSVTRANDLPLVGQAEERVCGSAVLIGFSIPKLPNVGHTTGRTLPSTCCRIDGAVIRATTASSSRLAPKTACLNDVGRFVWSLPQVLSHDPALGTLSVRVICSPRTEPTTVCSTTGAIHARVISHHVDIEVQLLRDTQAYLRSRARKMVPAKAQCEAWQEFYRHYRPVICRAVGAYGIAQAEREDCAQEIWVAIISKLPSLDPNPRRGAFRSWLSTLIYRHVVNVIRRTIRERPRNMGDWMFTLCAEDGDPAKAYEKWEVRQLVRGALDELQHRVSSTNFRIVHLRLIEGHDVSEVAARLGLSSGQVRNRLHRAIRKLRCLLKARSLCDAGVGTSTPRGPIGRRGKKP